MSFSDWLSNLFGGNKKKTAVPQAKPGVAGTTTVSKPKNQQVYKGRPIDVPEWAQGLSVSELVAEIPKHNVCKYMPKFELKKIMSTQMGPDGNLIPEYSGVAGDCGAVKQQGRKFAERNGQTMPYRYVDLNIAYRACCGIPQRCPFFQCAEGDNDAINSRRK